MKIGLAVCKCEINFNDNNITTFMFTEMSIGATFHHSVFQQALSFVYKYWISFFFSSPQSDYYQSVVFGYSFLSYIIQTSGTYIFRGMGIPISDQTMQRVSSTDEEA